MCPPPWSPKNLSTPDSTPWYMTSGPDRFADEALKLRKSIRTISMSKMREAEIDGIAMPVHSGPQSDDWSLRCTGTFP